MLTTCLTRCEFVFPCLDLRHVEEAGDAGAVRLNFGRTSSMSNCVQTVAGHRQVSIEETQERDH